MKRQLPKIAVICGLTATGKSDLAVKIAKRFGGEVISADSRQIYKGLDIGSGKITKREMRGIPHHLLDIADPKRSYSAERFKNDGTKAIEEILSRGKLPIICGGTGFYIDALVSKEEFPAVPPNKKLRSSLAKRSAGYLMKMISKLDPRRAKDLDPYNKVRIIRAIEIAKALGEVPRMKRTTSYETLWIGLTTDREKLKERIVERLLKRVDSGMIEETGRLHENGLSWKRMHELGLEYRYTASYLQKKIGRDEMIAKLTSEIFRFSKRQMAWFKRNKQIHWLDVKDAKKAFALVRKFK